MTHYIILNNFDMEELHCNNPVEIYVDDKKYVLISQKGFDKYKEIDTAISDLHRIYMDLSEDHKKALDVAFKCMNLVAERGDKNEIN